MYPAQLVRVSLSKQLDSTLGRVQLLALLKIMLNQ